MEGLEEDDEVGRPVGVGQGNNRIDEISFLEIRNISREKFCYILGDFWFSVILIYVFNFYLY